MGAEKWAGNHWRIFTALQGTTRLEFWPDLCLGTISEKDIFLKCCFFFFFLPRQNVMFWKIAACQCRCPSCPPAFMALLWKSFLFSTSSSSICNCTVSFPFCLCFLWLCTDYIRWTLPSKVCFFKYELVTLWWFVPLCTSVTCTTAGLNSSISPIFTPLSVLPRQILN